MSFDFTLKVNMCAQVAFSVWHFSPWVYLLSLSQSAPANMEGYLHDSSANCANPGKVVATPVGVTDNVPIVPVVLGPTLAARGGCAGRSQDVLCCGAPRRPCAADPLRTSGADRCPSASLGSPATPPVSRKQACVLRKQTDTTVCKPLLFICIYQVLLL